MKQINQHRQGPLVSQAERIDGPNAPWFAEVHDADTAQERQSSAALFAASYTLLDSTARALRVDATELAKGIDLAGLIEIASELDKWERNPDRYGGDLADLAQQARSQLAKLPKP